MARSLSKADLDQLGIAMDWSREQMRPFRAARTAALKQFVGGHYSASGPNVHVPMHLMELALSTYMHMLVGTPAVTVETSRRQLKLRALKLEMGLNHLFEEILLSESLESVIRDAMFSPFGIAKIGLNASRTVELGGEYHDVGQPFADHVSFDDFCIDMAARTAESVQYAGNRYRLTRDEMERSGLFDMGALKGTADTDASTINAEGDVTARAISRGESSMEEFRPGLDLWDVWLPQDGLVITFPEGAPDRIIRKVEYDGPEGGCYRYLVFNPVPDQILGLPPVALMADLHELANTLARKLRDQAERQKSIGGYASDAAEDADRVKRAGDGDLIKMNNPDRLKELSLGGIDPKTMAFLVTIKDWFSYFAGNLDALAGLGPQAETATQDLQINQNATRRMQAMQRRVSIFTERIARDLAYYLWTDPLIELPMVKRIPGPANIEIPMTFGPEDREGDLLDYNVKIEPYSVQPQTPSQKVSALMQLFTQVLAPMAPMLQQQGLAINIDEFLKRIAKYTRLEEELTGVIEYVGGEGASSTEQPVVGMPATSHRTYERINRPGATVAGKDKVLTANLLGAAVQPSEQAAAMRPTG